MSALQMLSAAQDGIEKARSPRSFSETVDQLQALLTARGLTIFATINFSDDAAKAGLQMLPTKLVIFGNPKGGTPIMQAAPSSALDFPLKALVSQDVDGTVWITYNTPEYLAERHGIPPELVKNIAGIRALVHAAVA